MTPNPFVGPPLWLPALCFVMAVFCMRHPEPDVGYLAFYYLGIAVLFLVLRALLLLALWWVR